MTSNEFVGRLTMKQGTKNIRMEYAPDEGLCNGKCDTRVTTHSEKGHISSIEHDEKRGKVCGSEEIKVLEHDQITAEVVAVKVTVGSLIEMTNFVSLRFINASGLACRSSRTANRSGWRVIGLFNVCGSPMAC